METLGINPQMLEDMMEKAKKYEKHLEYISNYQRNNPDKIKVKQSNYYKRLKQEFPDKYRDMLQKKKQYYAENVKAKRQSNSTERLEKVEPTEEHLVKI